MSEYQYYEFRAIDRPLTPQQTAELRQVSSRAQIDARSFVNEYNFGDFRGNVDRLMRNYFDAHLYVANWGTNKLLFRLPRRLVEAAVFEDYFDGEQNRIDVREDFVLVHFCSNLEGGDGWIDGDGRIEELLPIREELLAGDLRPLYLAWLSGVTDDFTAVEDPAEVEEPAVPPGLNELSEAQKAFAAFLRVEPDLLAVAAERSLPRVAEAGPEAHTLHEWLKRKPAGRKDDWLVKLVLESDPAPRWEILAEFRASRRPAPVRSTEKPRTLAELLAGAQAREEERTSGAKRKADAARKRHLDSLVGQEEKLWKEVEQAVQTKKKDGYRQAVGHLKDLRELAGQEGGVDAFDQRLKALRGRHANKSAFLRDLREARLGE